jgi:hypothetical protein
MYHNDKRITTEELREISDHVSPDYIDFNGYHYIVDTFDITIKDDTINEFDTEEYDFNTQVVNENSDSSIIYYHVTSIDNADDFRFSSDLSYLMEENKFYNVFGDSVPEMENYLNSNYHFKLVGEFQGDYLDYYEWYMKNFGILIPVNPENYPDDMPLEIASILAIKNNRVIDFYFDSLGLFIITILMNSEDTSGFDYKEFESEVLSLIPLQEGMTLQNTNVNFYATVPEITANVFNKYSKQLEKMNIDYSYNEYDTDEDGQKDGLTIHYYYDETPVSLNLFSSSAHQPNSTWLDIRISNHYN